MKTVLLNPGPVTLSRRVREAMSRPDLCHREPEFGALQDGLRRKLLDVYALDPTDWAAVLLTGSGTAAVEAMLTSLVPADGRVLIVENGVYGERMSQIARAHGIAHERVAARWSDAIDLSAVQRALGDGAFTHVAVVHHETTTGRLNDIAGMSKLAAAHGARLLLDGVSSFGAETLDFDGWHLDGCAATANKCLHGVPGSAFVLVRRAVPATAPSRTVYLDLHAYLAQQDRRATPFTQSVQTFYALDEALDEFFEEGGRSGRQALFRYRTARIREVLLALGVEPLLPDCESSCVLQSFRLPPGHDYEVVHDRLKQDGFIVYAGQGGLSGRVFRISVMGDITEEDLNRLLDAFSTLFPAGRRWG
ncbi:2-aminoethylphosphonate aminotransferase [Streptomyces sp. B1866]|uniref:2-aminoethylphosphonate aminotransferase n=1 Tax=Streptomyces sp. B1866 TaxID=3075431 RepID=UPI002891C49E|nr:2-aminoethylphosphonate aminotransferase [Streptomyces sp. B1866]MDT3399622.1 2-aminoethylphosphonate aminotransferase [Streptomyces sp. B1866]